MCREVGACVRSRREGCGSEILLFSLDIYESSMILLTVFLSLFLLVFGLTGPNVAFSIFSFSKARSFQPQPTR